MAAVLANHPSLASHTAAARLWGLLKYEPNKIHVTVPTWRRLKADFVLHFACLPKVDMRVEDGIPVTALARTKLDLAADFSTERLERVVERSEELRAFDLRALHDVIDRNPRHPGAEPLAQVLSTYAEDPAVLRSGLEKRFRAHVKEACLPRPSMNYAIAGMELDAYWERERFAVELDVFETHGTNVAFERDRIRDDDLLALGIEIIRVTGPRLRREPEEIMRRLSDHLARRRRELG